MGFACPNTAPQYEIAGALTPEIRERLGDHCTLIPGTPPHSLSSLVELSEAILGFC